MPDSDATTTDASSKPSILVQPNVITLIDQETQTGRQIALSECITPEAGPLPALLFAQVLLLSDMAKALRSMAETIKTSAASAGDHKESAQETIDDALGRVVGFMSNIPGMDRTVVEQMTTALRPPPGGGTPP
jgi:hypothetical protein